MSTVEDSAAGESLLGQIPNMPPDVWERALGAFAADLPADLTLLPQETEDTDVDDIDGEPSWLTPESDSPFDLSGEAGSRWDIDYPTIQDGADEHGD